MSSTTFLCHSSSVSPLDLGERSFVRLLFEAAFAVVRVGDVGEVVFAFFKGPLCFEF